jgi:dynein heavy chain, axonemal
MRRWLLEGLPNDNLSCENAIIHANARRWPLMIDPQVGSCVTDSAQYLAALSPTCLTPLPRVPDCAVMYQGQANKWIKAMEQESNLEVMRLSALDSSTAANEGVQALKTAVQFGRPVLIEDVGEELSPLLQQLLLKQVYKQVR